MHDVSFDTKAGVVWRVSYPGECFPVGKLTSNRVGFVCVLALLYLFYVFVVCSFVYDLRSLMISLGIVRPGYREGEGVAEISIYPIYTPLRQPRKKTK